MYKKFFGLKENPFNVTPDPRYLYSTPHTQEALACLTYCVQARKGFVLLTGDVGTGKTTLLNKLLEWLRAEQVATAFVFNPRLNTLQFLDYMMSDFGINCETRLKSQVLTQLNQWLLERYRAGGTTVLIVDEAQNVSPEVLEEIRLLTNLETSTEKLLQIVLSGQQELELRLRQPEFRQLRQRITLRCKTYPLTLEETHQYIATRLRVAGSEGRQIFTPAAIEAAHHYSEGIPRVVNVICEDALINAFADQKPAVDRGIVEAVARELELDIYPPTAPPPEPVVERVRVNEYSGTAYGLGAALEPEAPAASVTPGRSSAGLSQRLPTAQEDARPRRDVKLPASPAPAPAVKPPVSQRPPAKDAAAAPLAIDTPRAPASQPTAAARKSAAPATTSPAGNQRSGESTTAKSAAEAGPGGTASVSPVALLSPSTPSAERPAVESDVVQVLRSEVAAAKPPTARPAARPAIPLPKMKAGRKSSTVWVLLGLGVVVSLAAVLAYMHLGTAPSPPSPSASAPASSQAPAQPGVGAAAPVSLGETEASAPPQPASGPAAGEKSNAEVAPRPKAERVIAESKPTPATPRTGATVSASPPAGRLQVTANVEGARITLDGRAIPNAEPPHTFADLPPGVHQIVVSKFGYEDATGVVVIREGQTATFRARLSAPGGEINIVTNPPGLGVSIDGSSFTPSPVQMVVAEGSHTYRIKLPGSRVYEGTFEIKNGSIITRRVDFTGGDWLAPEEPR